MVHSTQSDASVADACRCHQAKANSKCVVIIEHFQLHIQLQTIYQIVNGLAIVDYGIYYFIFHNHG